MSYAFSLHPSTPIDCRSFSIQSSHLDFSLPAVLHPSSFPQTYSLYGPNGYKCHNEKHTYYFSSKSDHVEMNTTKQAYMDVTRNQNHTNHNNMMNIQAA
jgi:hypothetical protein